MVKNVLQPEIVPVPYFVSWKTKISIFETSTRADKKLNKSIPLMKIVIYVSAGIQEINCGQSYNGELFHG